MRCPSMALLRLLLLLPLWASWGCLADTSGLQPWSHDPLCWSEVTPRIVQAARPLVLGPHSFPARLQLAFEMEGEGLLLDLAQNRELMMGSSGLMYYLPDGTRTVHPTSPEGNCCYRGSIRGYPDSWANVCVCSGLSGLLTVSRFRSYSLESTPNGQTRAYRLEGMKPATAVCTQSRRFHPHLESKRTPLQRVKREAEVERGYVELVIVADHAEFKLDPNLNRTQTRILEIASHMDGFYRLLGLRVALVSAEVWNNGNRVSTNGSAKEILRRFLAWREKDLLPQIPHDNVQLIVGPPFPAGVIGASTQGSICLKGSGGVSMGHSVSSLIMASTLSHQLGHNLGLAHDSDGCGCDTSIRPQSRKCIMEAPTGIMPGLSFSTCSQRRFQEILQSNRVGCLLDQPEPARLVKSRCGNRLVEFKEQCDCGLSLECTDPCCNATTCQLIPGAQCATGQSCCHQCKLRSAGHTCRPVQNECDLPEFCDGTSALCPSNVYKQDGTLCEGGKAVCHGGICPTYLSQCQAHWGPDAVPTSEGCVASLNQRGDARGNCGQNPDGSYIPCAKSDVRCGQLQCEKKRNGTVKTPNCLRDTLKVVVVTNVVEEAWALSGTNCGPNKVTPSLSPILVAWIGDHSESQVQFLHPAERITQPELRSYSKAPPNRPRPPQWKSSTELQLMPTSKQPVAPGATRPQPPTKPLPPDPIPKDPQDPAGNRPGPPIRPLPPDPIPKIQSPGPTKPPPPQKPLPLDPPYATPSCDPEIQMLPSRPAPPPPPTLAGSSGYPHEI
ncbi:disintegrin and metalloproteinase domain-containing protein 15 [Ahaetulla prasina]|uniref:disintegrin and metalloproteinase domain-containing protein 15 n=1 Tax=Ahaetulla prasina TaxID=499056 RepID=UPI002648A594|nr:disintegrin and metalloproteinase domain-containing protein 15 [Ahaetulla prasina]